MKKYSEDLVNTGNFKADNINSRIMELADELATKDALVEWGENRAGFYVEAEDKNGTALSEEAHDVYLGYYEKHIDTLYKFANDVIEIDAPTEDEISMQKLSHYISEDDVNAAYLKILDAEEIGQGNDSADDYVLMQEFHANRYTINELLDLI